MAEWRTTCELDSILLEVHPQCRQCGIFVGPAHLTSGIDKEGICEECRQMQDVRTVQRWPLVDNDIYGHKEVERWFKGETPMLRRNVQHAVDL